jgi:hypothetical protein
MPVLIEEDDEVNEKTQQQKNRNFLTNKKRWLFKVMKFKRVALFLAI